MNLFAPKWKSGRPEKRIEWLTKLNLEKTDKLEIAANLAVSDVDASVREKADSVIQKIAQNESGQEMLTAVAKRINYGDVYLYLIDKITSQSYLVSLTECNNLEKGSVALSKITDQKMLCAVVQRASFGLLQSNALKRIDNKEIFRKILKDNSYIEKYKIMVIDKINDEEFLSEFVANCQSENLIEAEKVALKKIKDEELLRGKQETKLPEELHQKNLKNMRSQRNLSNLQKRRAKRKRLL